MRQRPCYTFRFNLYLIYFTAVIIGSISIGELNTWLTGIIFGVIVWGIILPINSMLGKVNPPWAQGFSTILASLVAFATYGVITTYTIKRYGSKEVE